jgi:hypothetical protein
MDNKAINDYTKECIPPLTLSGGQATTSPVSSAYGVEKNQGNLVSFHSEFTIARIFRDGLKVYIPTSHYMWNAIWNGTAPVDRYIEEESPAGRLGFMTIRVGLLFFSVCMFGSDKECMWNEVFESLKLEAV